MSNLYHRALEAGYTMKLTVCDPTVRSFNADASWICKPGFGSVYIQNTTASMKRHTITGLVRRILY